MIITAKYASTCPCCSVRINVGDRIEWSKGSPARHPACAAKGGAATMLTPRPAARSSYRSARGAGSAASVRGYSSYCTNRSGCGCYDCAS